MGPHCCGCYSRQKLDARQLVGISENDKQHGNRSGCRTKKEGKKHSKDFENFFSYLYNGPSIVALNGKNVNCHYYPDL